MATRRKTWPDVVSELVRGAVLFFTAWQAPLVLVALFVLAKHWKAEDETP